MSRVWPVLCGRSTSYKHVSSFTLQLPFLRARSVHGLILILYRKTVLPARGLYYFLGCCIGIELCRRAASSKIPSRLTARRGPAAASSHRPAQGGHSTLHGGEQSGPDLHVIHPLPNAPVSKWSKHARVSEKNVTEYRVQFAAIGAVWRGGVSSSVSQPQPAARESQLTC